MQAVDDALNSAPVNCEGLFDRSVSILCWAYNEELLIEDFLRRIDAVMKKAVKDYEIVLIDDCSVDRTNEIARGLMKEMPNLKIFRNETNRNVGYSTKRAIKEATKEFLFWQTIDWSYDIDRLREFLELLKTYDVVAGVRRGPVPQRTASGKLLAGLFLLFGRHLTKRSDTIGKALVSVCNYSLIRVLFQMPLSDYQNIVFYNTKFIQSLVIEADSSFVNPELLLKSYWRGKTIAEAPISFIPRTAGEAKGTRLKAIRKSISDVLGFWVKWVLLGGRGKVQFGRVARLDLAAWESGKGSESKGL